MATSHMVKARSTKDKCLAIAMATKCAFIFLIFMAGSHWRSPHKPADCHVVRVLLILNITYQNVSTAMGFLTFLVELFTGKTQNSVTPVSRQATEEEVEGMRVERLDVRKRKAESQLVETCTKKRKVAEKVEPTSCRQKRKLTDELEDDTQRKKCRLDGNDHEQREPLDVQTKCHSVQEVQTEACPTVTDQGVPHTTRPPMTPVTSADFGKSSSSSSEPKAWNTDHYIRIQKDIEQFKKSYRELKVLGRGGFGIVTEGIRLSDNKPVALKHIPIKAVEYTLVNCKGFRFMEISEVVTMAQAAGTLCDDSEANPHVIGLVEVFELESEVVIVMERPPEVMDFIDYLDMREETMTEQELKEVFKQLVDACVVLHKNGVFHRDIKGENILFFLDNGIPSIRIIDFGCSVMVQEEPYRNYIGTIPYAPPEVFWSKQYHAEPTTVWQIGVLLWTAFSGKVFNIQNYIWEGQRPIRNVSKAYNNFLSRCLTLDQNKRASLAELQCHPWLQ